MTLPISISYHASGIKVTDWGNWLGTGWSLNAGGSINRKMMGKPDEQGSNYLSGPTVKDASLLSVTSADDLQYLKEVNNGSKDAEPDIFSASIPGRSFKFLFNQKNNFEPIIIPYTPVKIERGTMTGGVLPLKITDENGTIYKFDDAESTQSSFGGILTGAISTWVITQMSSSNLQDNINFSYTSRYTQVSEDQSDIVIVNDQIYEDVQGVGSGGYGSSGSTQNYESLSSVFATDKKINEVSFYNGKVVFEQSSVDREDGYPGQKKLSKIKVYNLDIATNSYSLIKVIIFYQSYFNQGGSSPYLTSRIRLDAVAICDKNENVVEKYQFSYNENVQLPSRTSRKRDYWGYFNNKDNNTLVPQMTIPFQNSSGSATIDITIGSNITGSREPDPSFMQAYMLKSISYPTGGKTDFEYETNQYSDEQNNLKSAGGLRIKSIKSYDGISTIPIVKTYKYGLNESGGGRKNYFLNNYFFKTEQFNRFYYYNIFNPCGILKGTKRTRTYTSNPTIDIEPYDGTPVVYPVVTEYTGDETANTGKIVYTFYDRNDVLGQTMIADKPIITSYQVNRGLLKEKTVYKNISAGYVPVTKTANIYEAFPEQFYNQMGIVVNKLVITDNAAESNVALNPYDPLSVCSSPNDSYENGSAGSQVYQFTNYSIRSDDNRLIESTETTYNEDGSSGLTNTVKYTYSNFSHQQVTKIETTNSKNETFFAERKYPADFSSIEPYTTMLGKHILSPVIEEKKSKFVNNSTIILDKANTNYLDQGNGNYLPSTLDYQHGSDNVETRAMLNNYDPKGNILDMQKKNDIDAAYQWGYNAAYPVALVKNATNTYKETITYTNGDGSVAVTLNGCSSPSNTYSFTNDYAGTVQIKLGYSGGGASLTINYSGTLGSGTYYISSSSACGSNVFSIPNVAPGQQSLTLSVTCSNCNTCSQGSSNTNWGLCGEIVYPKIISGISSSGSKEFFYEGFEEQATATITTPCAGKRYIAGDYTVPFTKPTNETYTISYHYLQNGAWKSVVKNFNNNMTLTDGDAIDEVRVHPADAQMVTYTYEPLIGMTSECDANNRLWFYEYDNYGRLNVIRDDDKNILKKFQYQYTGNTETLVITPCSSSNCSGNDRKCINGSCEIGKRINTSTHLKSNGSGWKCTYYYRFSDGTRFPVSSDLTETNTDPCDL